MAAVYTENTAGGIQRRGNFKVACASLCRDWLTNEARSVLQGSRKSSGRRHKSRLAQFVAEFSSDPYAKFDQFKPL